MLGFPLIRTVAHCFRTVSSVVVDLLRLVFLAAHSRRALAAVNLFLRKQPALFQERKVKPRRANDSTRWIMATLGRMFPWLGAGECTSGYTHPLASQRIPAVLAHTGKQRGSFKTPLSGHTKGWRDYRSSDRR